MHEARFVIGTRYVKAILLVAQKRVYKRAHLSEEKYEVVVPRGMKNKQKPTRLFSGFLLVLRNRRQYTPEVRILPHLQGNRFINSLA